MASFYTSSYFADASKTEWFISLAFNNGETSRTIRIMVYDDFSKTSLEGEIYRAPNLLLSRKSSSERSFLTITPRRGTQKNSSIGDIALFKSVSFVYIIWIYLQIIYVVLLMHNNTSQGIINNQNIPKTLNISVNNFIVKY